METTLLTHGVPRENAKPLHNELSQICQQHGATPALIGIVEGRPVVGMNEQELDLLLGADVPKLNTANLGLALHNRTHGATTVSTTMELAHAAGVQVFSTGGIGGVHRGYDKRLDISADLIALTRFPIAVIASGVKSILDVASTREALETLGITVLGFRTGSFPAFYTRETELELDGRFDDVADLAGFVRSETNRTGRGILIANPVPEADAINPDEFDTWLAEATESASASTGRDVTPAILAQLHTLSNGRTLQANISLIKNNVKVGAELASALARNV